MGVLPPLAAAVVVNPAKVIGRVGDNGAEPKPEPKPEARIDPPTLTAIG
jgi:hypothetical protein